MRVKVNQLAADIQTLMMESYFQQDLLTLIILLVLVQVVAALV